jgi:hypothetical protein
MGCSVIVHRGKTNAAAAGIPLAGRRPNSRLVHWRSEMKKCLSIVVTIALLAVLVPVAYAQQNEPRQPASGTPQMQSSPAQASPEAPSRESSFSGTIVKVGKKYVLKTDMATYQLDDQEKAKQFEASEGERKPGQGDRHASYHGHSARGPAITLDVLKEGAVRLTKEGPSHIFIANRKFDPSTGPCYSIPFPGRFPVRPLSVTLVTSSP